MQSFAAKIKSDYDSIVDTKFWEVYQKRIIDWLKNASTDTNTLDPIENATKLAREQGKIVAFKQVLGLPDSIVGTNKSKE